MSGTTIDLNTKIAVGFLIAIIGAAVSFGIQMQKITNLESRMVRVENKLDKALEMRNLTAR